MPPGLLDGGAYAGGAPLGVMMTEAASAPGATGRPGLLAQVTASYGAAAAAGGGARGGYGNSSSHGKALLSSRFMTEALRQQLAHASYLTHAKYVPGPGEQPLPERLAHYHTLHPLEEVTDPDGGGGGATSAPSEAWGVSTRLFKGISTRDGRAYALRVVCGKQV